MFQSVAILLSAPLLCDLKQGSSDASVECQSFRHLHVNRAFHQVPESTQLVRSSRHQNKSLGLGFRCFLRLDPPCMSWLTRTFVVLRLKQNRRVGTKLELVKLTDKVLESESLGFDGLVWKPFVGFVILG
ncbi:hypothetical protein KCU92_g155, partial [Aureobasidium melanogenum]